MSNSSSTAVNVRIGDKIFNFRDIKDISEVARAFPSYTKCEEQSQKIIDEITFDRKKIDLLEKLGDALREMNEVTSVLCYNPLSLGNKTVFESSSPSPSNMTPEEASNYLQFDTGDNFVSRDILINIDQIARAEQWQSKSFASYSANVTQSSSGTNPNLFTAGNIQIQKNNNCCITLQKFSNATDPVVSNFDIAGKMKGGVFHINDFPILINPGDSLNAVITRINAGTDNHGVVASVSDDLGLKMVSKKIGIENSFGVLDPNGVFANLSKDEVTNNFMEQVPEYVTIPISQGDSLDIISKKINNQKKVTGLGASIAQSGNGSYRLALSSQNTGQNNAFIIKDNGIILNGSNSGTVFGSLFTDGIDTNAQYYSHQIVTGSDMLLRINGYSISSPSNKFRNKDGDYSIIAKNVTNSAGVQIVVSPDYDAIISAVEDFVDNSNNLEKLLSRYTYVDDLGKKGPESFFVNDFEIADLKSTIESTAFNLQLADIGLEIIQDSAENISVTDEKTGKVTTYRVNYNNLLKINKKKLRASLMNDFIGFQSVFDRSFYSENIYFIQAATEDTKFWLSAPVRMKNMEMNIDINRAFVRSRSSVSFSSPSISVVSANNNSTSDGFSPGLFYVNDVPVQLNNGDSLDDIVKKINDTTPLSNIRARILTDGTYYSLVLDDGEEINFDQRLSLSDPNHCLNRVFSPAIYTDELTVEDLGFDDLDRSFWLNGVEIIITGSGNHTIPDIVNQINSYSGDTDVTVTATLGVNPGSYYLTFAQNWLSNVEINDQDNFFNGHIISRLMPSNTSNYYETSEIANAEITLDYGGAVYSKRVSFIPINADDITMGAHLVINNTDQSNLKVNGLRIAYFGSGVDESKIVISSPIIGDLVDQINNASSYDGFITKKVREEANEVLELTDDLEDNEEKKREIFEENVKKVSQMQNQFSYDDHRAEMLKTLLSNIFDKNNKD